MGNDQDKKKINRIVTGDVKIEKKKSALKFGDVFLPKDMDGVKRYVLAELLIPEIKSLLLSIFETILNGPDGGRRSKSGEPTNYSRQYDNTQKTRDPSQSVYDFGKVYIQDRTEAQDVLIQMDDIINEYGKVSVSDLMDCLGKTAKWTDNKYGWTDIKNAKIVHTRYGWAIDLPKVNPLD